MLGGSIGVIGEQFVHVYYDEGREYNNVRLHPYQPNADEPAQVGFVDFKVAPEKIPEVLEDFLPHAAEVAVQTFYELLRWVNGLDSELESVDCAFRGPRPNDSPRTSDHALQADGRLCLMFRHLPANCHEESFNWLMSRLGGELQHIDVEMPASEAVIGFSTAATLFVDLSKTGVHFQDGTFESDEADPAHGKQVMLWFWAWGADEAAVFFNLDRAFKNIWAACRGTSEAIKVGNKRAREATDPS